MLSNKRNLTLLVLLGILFVGSQAIAAKVLFIDSYHEGYPWSDGIANGVQTTLGDKAELKIHRMDTKRNTSEEFKKEAALKAKAVIDEWKPDVVIAADDNASKFLIVPFYKDSDLPFVFCGVNWDASKYGFPCKNVCGMEEVSLVEPLLAHLKKFAKGDKIGFLATEVETAHVEKENCEKKFNLNLTAHFAKDYDDWKAGFTKLQQSCDMVIIESDGGVFNDKTDDMKAFFTANTSKPTGSCYDFMAPYALFAYAKSAEEHGQWAAAAALRILNGETPEKIGVTQNKKGKLYANLPIAKQAGVQVPLNVLKTATVIK